MSGTSNSAIQKTSRIHFLKTILKYQKLPFLNPKSPSSGISMSQYLLLRNNKQTGPFSLEEMIEIGFKPYDLIWVNGKSAGWRYPSELPEFKKFTAVTEEQPFDRFFKKDSKPNADLPQENTSSLPDSRKPNIDSPEKPAIAAQKPEEKSPNPDKDTSKKIFVTLPNTPDNEKIKEIIDEPVLSIEERASLLREKINQSARAKSESPISATEKEPLSQKTSFSESIAENRIPNRYYTSFQIGETATSDSISKKERPVVKIPARVSFSGSASLLRIAVAVCLVLGGVIIGLLISGRQQAAGREQLDQLVKEIQSKRKFPDLPAPENNTKSSSVNPLSGEKQTPPLISVQGKDVPADSRPSENKEITDKKAGQVLLTSQDATHKPTDEKLVKNALAREENPSKEDHLADKEITRKNIYQLVDLSGSPYKTGVLGGISDLELTVSNNSLYPIDEVEITLQYLGPEKRVVKKQILLVESISAGEQKTIQVPKSNRGVTVTYNISRINSRALGIASN